jgi:hypothetical protein
MATLMKLSTSARLSLFIQDEKLSSFAFNALFHGENDMQHISNASTFCHVKVVK